MTRLESLAITISLLFGTTALGQFIAPELTSQELSGPAAEYHTALGQTLFNTLEDLVKNPGLDTDNDGVTDLQEFLTGGDHTSTDADAPGRMAKFNLALALATDWTQTDGYGDAAVNDLQERLDQVFGASTTLPAYLPLEGLSPTLETQFHKELADLAKDLDYDPVKIYEWVYANIEFEDYAVSRKGALATYRTRRGNEWDQCSLLISLLRMSGVPARYAVGRTYESLEGNTDTEKDLVLVKAWLPLSSYPMASDANLDSFSRAWVSLVPWQKDARVTEGIDLTPVGSDGVAVIPSELKIADRLLTARWEFDGNASDMQNIHHGSVSGGVTYPTDDVRPGQVVKLTDGGEISIANHPAINDRSFTKRTISLWFKDDAIDMTGKQEMIFSQGIVTSGITIYLQNGDLYIGSYNRDLEFDWTVDSGGGHDGHWVIKNGYTAGTWHHVVLVLDAEVPYVAPNSNLRAYYDGSLVGSTTASIVHPDNNNTNGSLINQFLSARSVIGGSNSFTWVATAGTSGQDGTLSAATTSNFTGWIDDVRIYDGALTASEIDAVRLGQDITDKRNYLTPSHNAGNTSSFEAHTQKSVIEFLEDVIQDYLETIPKGPSLPIIIRGTPRNTRSHGWRDARRRTNRCRRSGRSATNCGTHFKASSTSRTRRPRPSVGRAPIRGGSSTGSST